MKINKIYIFMLVFTLCLCGCGVEKRVNEEMDNKIITNIEAIHKMFPKLQGVTKTSWESIPLGQNKNTEIPGPTDYIYRGFIQIDDENAEEYYRKYEWNKTNPTLESEQLDLESVQDETWYYSEQFKKDIVPAYYSGEIYFSNGKLWFSIMTS